MWNVVGTGRSWRNALEADAKRSGTSSWELLGRGAVLYPAVVVAARRAEHEDLAKLLPAILAALNPPNAS